MKPKFPPVLTGPAMDLPGSEIIKKVAGYLARTRRNTTRNQNTFTLSSVLNVLETGMDYLKSGKKE